MRTTMITLLGALLLAGCVAGPGKKPGTMRLKEFKEAAPVAFSPAAWRSGGLEYSLAEVLAERRYTVFGTRGRRFSFKFEVRNLGATEEDVFARMLPADVQLSDGSRFERITWTAGTVKLAPGGKAAGMYFVDGLWDEGVRLRQFRAGSAVLRWP